MFKFIHNFLVTVMDRVLYRNYPKPKQVTKKEIIAHEKAPVQFTNVKTYAKDLLVATSNERRCSDCFSALRVLSTKGQHAVRFTLEDVFHFDGKTESLGLLTAAYYKYDTDRWHKTVQCNNVNRSVLELLIDEFILFLAQDGWTSMNDSAEFMMEFIGNCVKSNGDYAKQLFLRTGNTSVLRLRVHYVLGAVDKESKHFPINPHISVRVTLTIKGQDSIVASQQIDFTRVKNSVIKNHAA